LAKLHQVKAGAFFGTQCRNIALLCGVKKYFNILNRLGVTQEFDGRTDMLLANAVRLNCSEIVFCVIILSLLCIHLSKRVFQCS